MPVSVKERIARDFGVPKWFDTDDEDDEKEGVLDSMPDSLSNRTFVPLLSFSPQACTYASYLRRLWHIEGFSCGLINHFYE